MKFYTKLFSFLFLSCLVYFSYVAWIGSANNSIPPKPTEGDDSRLQRYQWFEMLHRTQPNTDWRAIDKQTRLTKAANRLQLRQSQPYNKQMLEILANGQLMGNWQERGSNNQSGSIRVIEYTPDDNAIYAIGDGGTLFKGNLNGSAWTSLNEDLRFGPHILEVIPITGGKRILAAIGKSIYYSDDNGQTWTASTGFGFYDDWGDDDFWNRRQIVVLNDANNTIYYFTNTWDSSPWAGRVWLFRSIDKGASFSKIHTFSHGDYGEVAMWHPYESDETWLIDKNNMYHLDGGNTLTFNSSTTGLPSSGNKLLVGHKSGSTNTMYVLNGVNAVYTSTNNGVNWTFKGTTPVNAWEVGINTSLTDPNVLFLGAVNAYRSSNGGSSWTEVNDWPDYYWWEGGDGNALHADIMEFRSYRKADNTPFTLIANHGGLHVSYDNLLNTTNIGTAELNVSQYYDVLTNPSNTNYIYGGSQDQGHQVADNANTLGILNFDQLWSGDYGHMVLTNNNQTLWTMYINGNVNLYSKAINPLTHYPSTNWVLPGTDRPANNWIIPTSNTNSPNANEIFLAGGNINEGSGSYLIKLTALTTAPYTITPTQYNYDFKANSNDGSSLISAIEASSISSKIFVATGDGTFFYSNDNGSSWNKATGFGGPEEYWVYGSCILASKVNNNLVYFSGSGYNNPPVYTSTNGGQTFTAMSNGLPNTLVIELAANADESLIFAATEVGPYVYVVAENMWYDMMGMGAPQQFYYSVEFVNSGDGIVRFGTYGRGVWDFTISSSLAVEWTKLEAEWQAHNEIAVKWIVANEKNNQHFIIERSANGQAFNAIGKVDSKGNSEVTQSYHFIDKKPLSNINYYRLQQLDENNKINYSDIVSVKNEPTHIFSIYPNPVLNKKLWIKNSPAIESLEVQIFDATGKQIQSFQLRQADENTAQVLDLQNLSSGIYFIHLDTKNGKQVEKIIVE